MSTTPRVLVVEDQPREREALSRVLRTEGYQPIPAGSFAEALPNLRETLDAVVCDLRLGSESGFELLKSFKAARESLPFVIVTAFGDVSSAVAAMKFGADDYLTKPVNPGELLLLMRRLTSRDSAGFAEVAERPNSAVNRILGRSKAIADVRARILRAAASDSLVLLLGESGTGKELVAAAIHEHSSRSTGPYVPFNVAAVPDTLIEAELFGNVKGAFTGAEHSRVGRFEAADTGTLFLDEVGDFPLASQAKLLRVLENYTVNPVGSNEERRVNVRVIAATNRDLAQRMHRGEFRQDLFYRLNVLTIQLPPLRSRREDIPLLCQAFLAEQREKNMRPRIRLDPELQLWMETYDWPGNVRQLRNTIENMVALSRSDLLTATDLPYYLSSTFESARERTAESGNLDDLERNAIKSALERSHGNRTSAARALGISVRTLQRRLKNWSWLADPGQIGGDGC